MDELTITSLMKRPHWYSLKKQEYLDVENKNTLITISDVKNWTSIKPVPVFIIAPSFGLGYSTDLKLKPFVGISTSYYPISIKIY